MDHVLKGVGVGIRPCQLRSLCQKKYPKIQWLEVVADQFLDMSGENWSLLLRLREQYPVALHCVSMSLGSTDALNFDYLAAVKRLAMALTPVLISDHLSWSSLGGEYSFELLPLPMTMATVRHVAQRIQRVQDFFGQRILIENISRYLQYQCDEMPEHAFLNAVLEAADCNALLDVNNLYVNAFNYHFHPLTYLNALPAHRIQQLHIAGHEDQGTHLLDTHGQAVAEPVWSLMVQAIARFGPVPVLLERDHAIPSLPVLYEEVERAHYCVSEGIRAYEIS